MLKDEALARWREERHPQQKALHEQRHGGEKQCLAGGRTSSSCRRTWAGGEAREAGRGQAHREPSQALEFIPRPVGASGSQ